MPDVPTDADLVLLGLLTEQPRHAYDLEAELHWTTQLLAERPGG